MGRKSSLRLKGVSSILFVSHLLFLIISYSIYLAPYIAPSTFPYFGIIPIIFPILVVINFILAFFLIWKRPSYGILFFVLSIGLIFPLTKTYQYFGDNVKSSSNFKLITYNAHYFREEGAAHFFNQENADVILLQEVYWRDNQFKEVQDSAFQDYYQEKNSIIHIFSKYPIIEFKNIFSAESKSTAYASYADIDVGNDTIRLINVYLASMLIDKELVKGSLDTEQAEQNTKIISNKLSKGFLLHENQVKKLIPYISQSKHPVILAGDLNSVPNSYEYQQISYWLKDAYYHVGKSSGTTFHDFKYPLRLDYIFHTEDILPIRIETRKDIKLSDHYPVIGYFKLP